MYDKQYYVSIGGEIDTTVGYKGSFDTFKDLAYWVDDEIIEPINKQWSLELEGFLDTTSEVDVMAWICDTYYVTVNHDEQRDRYAEHMDHELDEARGK